MSVRMIWAWRNVIESSLVLGFVLVEALVAFGAFRLGRFTASSSVARPHARPLSVRITLNAFSSIVSTGQRTSACVSEAPFDDVQSGVPVVLVNADEHVVAAARLHDGRVVRGSCVFDFTVRKPAASPWYLVQIGNHQSTPVTATQLATKPIRFG